MKTILVSGASGIVGYGCLKSICMDRNNYKLIGASIYTDSVASKFCDIFELSPVSSSPGYTEWLVQIIKKHAVDLIIPGIEIDVQVWTNNIGLLKRTGTKVLLNNPELIKLCADKWNFYNVLKDSNSEYSIDSEISNDFDYLSKKFGLPFLLKPRKGYGSKGIVRVGSESMFNLHKENIGDVLFVQPIVGSDEEEYTIAAFFDKESKLCAHMTLKRKLSPMGFTEKAEVATLENAEIALVELAKNFNPVGPTNFQFRRCEDELKLLEINPRISSATSIRAAFGYNESLMSIDYFFNDITPSQPKILRGSAIRYTEDYIKYDRNYF